MLRIIEDLSGLAKTDIDWRPNDPRQHIEARQSVSTHAVRSGSLGRVGQGRAQAMGALWPQVVDRGSQTTAAPNVLAIALANKLARIAWAVLHNGRAFEYVK